MVTESHAGSGEADDADQDNHRHSDGTRVLRLLVKLQCRRHDVARRQQCMIAGLCKLLDGYQGAASRWTGFEPGTRNLALLDMAAGGAGSLLDHVLIGWDVLIGTRFDGDFRTDLIMDRGTHVERRRLHASFARSELLDANEWDRSPLLEHMPALKATGDQLTGFFRHARSAAGGMTGVTIYRPPGDKRPFTRRDRRVMSDFMAGLSHLHRAGLLGPPAHESKPPSRRPKPRQQRVLELLLTGRADKEIAAALGMAACTVQGHVRELLQEYRVGSRSELQALFVRVSQQRAADRRRQREELKD